MEKMNDLRDLLKHELQDLYSAEEQIIEALPAMITRATDSDLKKSLQQHLKVTEKQRTRLNKVLQLMGEQMRGEDKGLFDRLFKSKQTCRGMEGIIEEGNKIMKEDMDPDVMDAAIIASSQKVEHYEICGYGTAKSYAEELGLTEVAQLLEETLNEEYEADVLLTQLAENRVNKEARAEGGSMEGRNRSRSGSGERVRTEEPEMEVVSRGNQSSERKSTGSSRSEGAPRSSGSGRESGSSARNSGSTSSRRSASTKTESKNARSSKSSTSGGRSSSGGRTSRSR
jgi:ferritin-like metal-binding protein YciE